MRGQRRDDDVEDPDRRAMPNLSWLFAQKYEIRSTKSETNPNDQNSNDHTWKPGIDSAVFVLDIEKFGF